MVYWDADGCANVSNNGANGVKIMYFVIEMLVIFEGSDGDDK